MRVAILLLAVATWSVGLPAAGHQQPSMYVHRYRHERSIGRTTVRPRRSMRPEPFPPSRRHQVRCPAGAVPQALAVAGTCPEAATVEPIDVRHRPTRFGCTAASFAEPVTLFGHVLDRAQELEVELHRHPYQRTIRCSARRPTCWKSASRRLLHRLAVSAAQAVQRSRTGDCSSTWRTRRHAHRSAGRDLQ